MLQPPAHVSQVRPEELPRVRHNGHRATATGTAWVRISARGRQREA
jgi:hypothetical protein